MVEEIRRERSGRFPNLFHMQLYNLTVTDGWLRLGTAVRYKFQISTGRRPGGAGDLSGGDPHRGRVPESRPSPGSQRWNWVSPAKSMDYAGWKTADWFDAKQRAVLALAEQLTRRRRLTTQPSKARAVTSPAHQTVELVTTIAYYNMVARFLVGLKIDLETPDQRTSQTAASRPGLSEQTRFLVEAELLQIAVRRIQRLQCELDAKVRRIELF